VIGKTGSGKTNLISALLGDMFNIDDQLVNSLGGVDKELATEEDRRVFMRNLQGHNSTLPSAPICINGTMAYSQQTPWIQSKTIRENILYEAPLDKARYYDVIRMCELENDFKGFNAGDLSEIGENGINLSGGQKARIGLARAVYSNRDIYLMDDPISALDARVRRKVFMNCLMNYLKEKTRILITHSIDFLSLSDRIVIMDEGKVYAFGTFEELKSDPKMKALLKINDINKNRIDESTGNMDDVDSDLEAIKVEEMMNSVEQFFAPQLTSFSSTKSQVSENEKVKRFEGLGDWTKQKDGEILDEEDDDNVVVENKSYWKLFNLQGGILMLIATQLMMWLIEYVHRIREYDITAFSHLSAEEQKATNAEYAKKVLTLTVAAFFPRAMKGLSDFFKKRHSSLQVHDSMLKRMMNAPVNLFFDTHRQDKIQERFTSDLREVETNMVGDFLHMFYYQISMLMIVFQVQWQVVVFYPLILGSMYWLWTTAFVAHNKLDKL